jgi:hypothetical protein
MKLKHWLAAMASAAALGLVAVPAQAAPAGLAGSPQAADAATTDVKPVHWNGRRYHYRRYGRGYYYGPRYRHRHYYGPGFRFYYGPRYYRRHWHYRGW